MYSICEVNTNISVLANHRNWSLYYPTLSIWSILVFLPICFSIIFFHFTSICRTSNICLIGYTQHRLDISSINEIKYRWPPNDATLVGSQNTNMNTINKTFQAVSCGVEFHLCQLVHNVVSTQFKITGKCTFHCRVVFQMFWSCQIFCNCNTLQVV